MKEKKQVYDELSKLLTEQRNTVSVDIDKMDTASILKLINAEDKFVATAVEKEIPYIASAVELIIESFKAYGRLIYVGAGTSGRLGVVDAAECPPTFGTNPEMIIGLIAGGRQAVFNSQEGAEDNTQQAKSDLEKLGLTSSDVVCGIAASSRTPYVIAAIEYARVCGASTIFITTNPRKSITAKVDVAICPEVGPEVIMGSTRMKSGTAQKLVLNMLTTTAMIRLGKVYENMMVDLQLTNQKLGERAKRIIMLATGVNYENAAAALASSGGHVKTAIVMIVKGVSPEEAKLLLTKSGGFVRVAIDAIG